MIKSAISNVFLAGEVKRIVARGVKYRHAVAEVLLYHRFSHQEKNERRKEIFKLLQSPKLKKVINVRPRRLKTTRGLTDEEAQVLDYETGRKFLAQLDD